MPARVFGRLRGPKDTQPLRSGLYELAEAIGPERVHQGEDIRRQHGTDESWHPPAPPDAVLYPRSTEEAALIVSICARHRLPIVPFGAGTSLEGHVAALEAGVCLDMSQMNKIVRLSVEDLDATVEAGVTRLQLEKRLHHEGVFFPVDPGADATIGGMVATGASGTTTCLYGGMRDNVIALTVVTAHGDIIKTRSRARKSSAGYDLTRLFIGSEGTLGLITDATLRLRPFPEAVSAAVCSFTTLESAVACVTAVVQSGIPMARAELLDDHAIDAVNRRSHLGLVVAPTVFFEFHGSPQSVKESTEEVRRLTADFGARSYESAVDEAARRQLWLARHQAYESVLALRPGSKGLTTDACVPISRLVECLVETRQDLNRTELEGVFFGHVGDGNFHAVLLVDTEKPAEVDAALAFHKRLALRAIAAGGTCTGEHGVGYGKSDFLPVEHGSAAIDLMRAIKSALDPHGIFNPGKVLPVHERLPIRETTT